MKLAARTVGRIVATALPGLAVALAAIVLAADDAQVRFTGPGLLVQVGAAAMPAWQSLLASDDFGLRKQTLRRIREMADPRFLPLLEQHLEKEKLPGNRHLTAAARPAMQPDTAEPDSDG